MRQTFRVASCRLIPPLPAYSTLETGGRRCLCQLFKEFRSWRMYWNRYRHLQTAFRIPCRPAVRQLLRIPSWRLRSVARAPKPVPPVPLHDLR